MNINIRKPDGSTSLVSDYVVFDNSTPVADIFEDPTNYLGLFERDILTTSWAFAF